jgi:hypothetical protein
MRLNLRRALVASLITVLVLTGLLAPLHAVPYGPPILNDIVGILIGATLAGGVTLALFVVPILMAVRWFVGSRFALSPPAWAVAGSCVVATLMFVLNSAADAAFGVSSVETAAPWPALIVGGAVCGWFMFSEARQAG